ncbi:MAG TPA: hypothetical protein VMH85_00495 [Terriglobales bacterium]|nr:hypothetical protein [Terriglobales bacterium]
MPDAQPNARRWTVIASGLLCIALALVVIFTSRSAFFNPITVVVVAAIGSVALLLQLRLRDHHRGLHSPIWLNALGILFALAALLADRMAAGPRFAQAMAFAAVGSFGVSGAIILHAFRKDRMTSK